MNASSLRPHRARLADPVRMKTFQRAIEAVCRGKVVCEIGAGIGTLSLMALRAGAARVYAIEKDAQALALAESVLARNGFGASSFVAVQGPSYECVLPEPADVVLSGLLQPAGMSPFAQYALEDARHRLARPGAVFVPERLTRVVALARPRMYKHECDFWDADLFVAHGLDFADVVDCLRASDWSLRVRPDELATGWAELPALEFGERRGYGVAQKVRLQVVKPGTVTGFCVAFEARLAADQFLCNRPGSANVDWEIGFCPFEEPLACGEGDLVELSLKLPREGHRGRELRAQVRHVPAPRVADFLGEETDTEEREVPQLGADAADPTGPLDIESLEA